jgi:hypothetical protein
MTTAYFLLGIITLATLFYIFNVPLGAAAGPEKTRLNYLQERKEVIYENMRDLNFEYRAGKLSDEDYNSLKASLEEEAAAVLAEAARLQGTSAANISETKEVRV